MHIKCIVAIDNPDERELFIKKVKCLGVKMSITGTLVQSEYIGYNRGLTDVLIQTYEEQPRAEIKIL